jgi:hypothetical protein
MRLASAITDRLGRVLASFLQQEWQGYRPVAAIPTRQLGESLKPGDILLVEGDRRVSVAIKYLTQSTWSHAALYVGPEMLLDSSIDNPLCLVEADMVSGVIAVPLSKYAGFNVRICRPVGIQPEDLNKVLAYATGSIGKQYDISNAVDLVRYLLPQPPVPVRWRRKMLSIGSGDPTRAICSTLIASAFETVGYPILPHLSCMICNGPEREEMFKEIRHVTGNRLYAPRDFDISPYFQIIKPMLESGFKYREQAWDNQETEIKRIPAIN